MFLNVPKCKIIAANRIREAPPRPSTRGGGGRRPPPAPPKEGSMKAEGLTRTQAGGEAKRNPC